MDNLLEFSNIVIKIRESIYLPSRSGASRFRHEKLIKNYRYATDDAGKKDRNKPG